MTDQQTRAVRRFGLGALVGLLAGFIAKDLALPDLLSYWYDRTPLVLLLGLVGGVLWMWRPGRWLVSAGAGLAGLLWLLVAYTPLTGTLAESLPQRGTPATADAIFVLSSSLQEDGELGSVSMSRLLGGLTLLQEGYAPRLILSELYPPNASYEAAARPLLEKLHITGELLTVGPVHNTHDEAVAVGELFRARGWRRLLLVTSPAHSQRAARAFAHQGIEVISVPSTETRYDLENLRGADDRINAFGSLAHEWIGLWLYQRRGWLKEQP